MPDVTIEPWMREAAKAASGIILKLIAERDSLQKTVSELIDECDAAQRECKRLRTECHVCGVELCKGATVYCSECGAKADDLQAANKAIKAMGETCDHEIERLKSCISAQSWMCAKYHEAVALLRRWVVHSCDWETESDRDESEALFERDTPAFLATIDAEEAKLSKD
jgi:hypothetical protein